MQYRIKQLRARLMRLLHRAFALYLLLLAAFVVWDMLHPTPRCVLNMAEGAGMLSLFAIDRWNKRRGPRQSRLVGRLDLVLTFLVSIAIVLTNWVL